jgi:ABC-type bacteriocin/lantibiotic exporter with double-glycine peptidase domain
VPNTLLPIPHHLQQSDGDCLAACAAMTLGYLDVPIDYGRLLRLLGVTPYGTPGSRLNRLMDLNVHVRYAQGTMDELYGYLNSGQPCIALVHTGQLPYWTYATDHAVLVVGFDEQAVYVNDPAFESAPQRVPRADFELAWLEFDYRYAVIWR